MFSSNIFLMHAVGAPLSALELLGLEPNGFTLSFLDNTYATRRSTPAETATYLLGDEYTGFAIDFTVNAYAINRISGAEALIGGGPYSAKPGLAIDFTDNSTAIVVKDS